MTPFLSAVGTAAALYGTLEISDQSEVRTRSGARPDSVLIDLETTPTVKIGVRSRRWEISAGYAPHLTLYQIGAGAQPGILHGVWVGATFHDRVTSLSFYENASYGDQTFTSLAPDPTVAPGSPLQPIPAAELIHYASSRTGCSARFSAPRRWVFGAQLEYALSGGTDASSRAAVPFQIGPHAAVSAGYAASRGDSVTASLDVSRALFSSGEDDVVVQLTESWRHLFGADTASTLGAGIGWAATRDGALDSIHSMVSPVATAALTRRFRPSRVDTGVSLRLSPVVNRLNGVVGEWLEGTATARWSPSGALSVQGMLGAARSIGTQAGAAGLVLDEVTVSYRLSHLLELRGGARTVWTTTLGGDASPFLWVVFAGVTIRAPLVRF